MYAPVKVVAMVLVALQAVRICSISALCAALVVAWLNWLSRLARVWPALLSMLAASRNERTWPEPCMSGNAWAALVMGRVSLKRVWKLSVARSMSASWAAVPALPSVPSLRV